MPVKASSASTSKSVGKKATANPPAGKNTSKTNGGPPRTRKRARVQVSDVESEPESESEALRPPKKEKKPTAKATPKATAKATAKPKPKTKEAVKQEIEADIKDEAMDPEPSLSVESAEEEQKWWEQGLNDDSIKWETLEHNGVMFPPAYEALPDHVHLIYAGKPVKLPLEAEEVAGYFGAMLNSGDHCQNPVFQENFFNDFCQVLKETKQNAVEKASNKKVNITDFKKMDFSSIFQYYDQQREAKKGLTTAEKKKIKAEKDEIEEPFRTCIFNGRKENVGNFRIEPPGLFRGRGKHPKTGKLKRRVLPEQVTINIGEGSKVPEPPAGHEWAEVRHDKTVSWLAMWKENINGNIKYVFLAQNSSIKGMSDLKKFEKARELKNHVEKIRKDYRAELTDEIMLHRQRATAMYLIDVLALRAGGEKNEDEADTVGCCSLRYEHITLEPPNLVTFDFLGKDSIRFFQKVEVDKQVFQNLRIFKKAPKTDGDDIFDRLDPSILNKHLQSYMPGLSAKVFRTYNASHTMQQQLDKIKNEGTVNEKVLQYNGANREVAILCNHQRTVAKGHQASVQKVEERIEELQWQKIRLKKMILQLDGDLKKDKSFGKDYWKDLTMFNVTKMKAITKRIIEKEREKVEKKHKRDLEKAEAIKAEDNDKDVKLPTAADLKESLEAVKLLHKQYDEENSKGPFDIKASQTVEKMKVQVTKLDERINNTRISLQDKQENSTVSLGTSKMNYIDPRLTVMFSKKYSVPIEKLFTKTLREKFEWAIQSADENWKF